MRLLHVADLHLDRSFEGITHFPDWLQSLVDAANQTVWNKIIQLALEKQVDVLLLAGDTFHQTQASLKMQQIFFNGLNKLADANISVVMCFGNHDYYRPEMFWFAFPNNVTVFTQEAVETKTLQLANGETVSFSSFSYTSPWIREHKAIEFPEKSAADYHIGLYHGELGQENQYAPFQISELQAKGYDYWALGHIHKGGEVFDRGYYPGTPQGHSQKEETGTGVLLVDLNPGAITVEEVDTAEIIWKSLTISLQSAANIQEVQPFLLQQLPASDGSVGFLALAFKDYQHLGTEFTQRINDGEFIQLLQQEAAIVSQNKLFIHQLALIPEDQRKTQGLIPEELLQQTLATYSDGAVFKEVLQDLLEQPELARLLDVENFQQQVLLETEKLVTDSLD